MSGAVEGVREVAVKTEATRLMFEQIHREGGREVAGHRVTADMAIMAAGVLETVCHDLAAVLTTPPARSYADGVEDAAKVADDYALGAFEGGEPLIEATAEEIAAAIRLLSQGGKA